MNVYFIPLGPDRFEPYFEHEDAAEAPDDEVGRGLFARLSARFSSMVREAERQRHESTHQAPLTAMGRLQRRVMGWVAERVAEQRLLWRLRREEAAVLHVSDALEPGAALGLFKEGLQRDADRHLRLTALHSVGLLAAAPFALVPGPNLLGYFFTFTVVGHFLSYRGARRGLTAVRWRVVASPELTDLGRAVAVAPPHRYRLIHEAAGRLRLPHLARFVERMAAPPA